jgi:hypothetical protein
MRSYESGPQQGQAEDAAASLTLPEITFTLDGVKFTCVREMDGDALLEWSELGIAASDDVAADSPEGAAYIARFLRVSFGASEYQRFRRHIRSHKTPVDVVLKVVAGIQEEMAGAVEDATGRPTVPPSSSSPGDAGPGGQRARVVSLSRGEVQWVDPPAPADHLAKGGKPRRKASGA